MANVLRGLQAAGAREICARLAEAGAKASATRPAALQRLPFDHHETIAAIAPRAAMVANTNDDYADGAEGDAIGDEGAMPFQFLGAEQNLALDLSGGGDCAAIMVRRTDAGGCETRMFGTLSYQPDGTMTYAISATTGSCDLSVDFKEARSWVRQ